MASRGRGTSRGRSRRPGGVFQARFQIVPLPSRARRHGYGCRPCALNVFQCVCVWRTQFGRSLPYCPLRDCGNARTGAGGSSHAAGNETRATQRSYCDFWQWIWNTQFAVWREEWGVGGCREGVAAPSRPAFGSRCFWQMASMMFFIALSYLLNCVTDLCLYSSHIGNTYTNTLKEIKWIPVSDNERKIQIQKKNKLAKNLKKKKGAQYTINKIIPIFFKCIFIRFLYKLVARIVNT